MKSGIKLPRLPRYPRLPGLSVDAPEDERLQQLLQEYQDFVFDLHCGTSVTRLKPGQEHARIHLQLLGDMRTLQVDHGSGCIIEFPLVAASKVQRIVKNNDRWHSAGTLTGPDPLPPLPLSSAEHIVVVEFDRRKLAFVFEEMRAAHRFFVCMELLVRWVQEGGGELEACTSGVLPESLEDPQGAPGRRFGGGARPSSVASKVALHVCRATI